MAKLIAAQQFIFALGVLPLLFKSGNANKVRSTLMSNILFYAELKFPFIETKRLCNIFLTI